MPDPDRENTSPQGNFSEAAPPGSLAWFVCLYAPAGVRRRLTATFAFRYQINQIVRRVQEDDIARIKLAWWREEIDRYAVSRPVHPVCMALLDEHGKPLVSPGNMTAIVDAAQMDLALTRFSDPQDLLAYCRLGGGNLMALQAELLSERTCAGQSDDYLRSTGCALRLIEMLRDLRADLGAGQVYLPLQWLDDRELTVADLDTDRPRAEVMEIPRMMDELIGQQCPEIDANAFSQLQLHPSIRVNIAIHQRIIDKMRHNNYRDIFRRKTALSTFEMMRVSWRAARRTHLPVIA